MHTAYKQEQQQQQLLSRLHLGWQQQLGRQGTQRQPRSVLSAQQHIWLVAQCFRNCCMLQVSALHAMLCCLPYAPVQCDCNSHREQHWTC
jgi:hypothetical protein